MSMLKIFREWRKNNNEEYDFKKMWLEKNSTALGGWSCSSTRDYFLEQAYYVMQLERRIEDLEANVRMLIAEKDFVDAVENA